MRFGAQNRNLNGFGRTTRQGLLAAASGLAVLALSSAAAIAQTAAPAPADQNAAPAPADQKAAPAPADQKAGPSETPEIVVNGIPYHETVLPTRLSSSSVYGLDLNVMDTPRNTTLLSNTQLQTLNIQDPRAFSYLTASSYTDSAFGTPNIPRIRGQYADTFVNGMRNSFTVNGYGAPPNFDSLDTINIVKGPASVVDGPGPGVGGEADFITKRPNMFHMVGQGEFSVDTFGNRRWSVDVGGPLIKGDLGVRISYSGDDDDSYFYGHYFRKNAVYGALRWRPSDKYQLDFNTEINVEQYTENVGVNRVNQALISHDRYMQGAPTSGDPYATFLLGGDVGSFPVGSPGNPYSPVAPVLTGIQLTNEVPFNTKVTIDQTPGTSARALMYNAQLIQRYDFNDNLSIENNTFFNYINSDNQDFYYFADSTKGSWTFENRTELHDKVQFSLGKLGSAKNESVMGVSFRYAHVDYISDFSSEPAAAYDLTSNPSLWVFDGSTQLNFADAFIYKSAMGRAQYGVPGRDIVNAGNTGVSNMFDTAVFFQDRTEWTPQLSTLFGARIDALQNHTFDPLGGAVCDFCFTSVPGTNNPLPQSHTSGVFGLGDANASVVYRFMPEVSAYATVDWTQSTNPNGGNGGVNSFDRSSDAVLLRSDSYLYEAGLKFNLLNNKLFIGTAGFDQKRSVPTGAAGTQFARANIRGFEIEANYQPTRNLFATASYSYIDTTLNKAAGFYNFPADNANNYPNQPFNFIDGAALFVSFAPGQKFEDPGVPKQIFNFLGNYKFDSGIGFRFGVQVIGPIQTTTSGYLLPGASCGSSSGGAVNCVPQSVINNNYYYKSPVIPWQYTMNAAVFYEVSKYTFTLSVYNLTDQLNWQAAVPFYGNDFLVRNDPRTVEFRAQAKF